MYKLMLKLKLQYFGHLIGRAHSLEKILMLGKIEDRRRKETEDEMVGWHQWTRVSKLRETVKDRETWHNVFYGVTLWSHTI